jgi:hypothetical protein
MYRCSRQSCDGGKGLTHTPFGWRLVLLAFVARDFSQRSVHRRYIMVFIGLLDVWVLHHGRPQFSTYKCVRFYGLMMSGLWRLISFERGRSSNAPGGAAASDGRHPQRSTAPPHAGLMQLLWSQSSTGSMPETSGVFAIVPFWAPGLHHVKPLSGLAEGSG